MKIAICYESTHHGNTLRVVQAMAQEAPVDLIDVQVHPDASLDSYDCIGFASGIYAFEFGRAVTDFARRKLPLGKDVFIVYTYSGAPGKAAKTLENLLAQRQCKLLGTFSCQGMTTFGPFKWLGGFPKGHPNEDDFAHARAFLRGILK